MIAAPSPVRISPCAVSECSCTRVFEHNVGSKTLKRQLSGRSAAERATVWRSCSMTILGRVVINVVNPEGRLLMTRVQSPPVLSYWVNELGDNTVVMLSVASFA